MKNEYPKYEMFVVKRNNQTEEVAFDKITKRVKALCDGLDMKFINPTKIAQKVTASIKNMITTQELDILASKVAADLVWSHPDYAILAGRIAASNLRKEIKVTFSEAMGILYNHHRNGEHVPIISQETWDIVQKYADKLDDAIVHDRDMDYDVFGFETLKRSYLLKSDRIWETPQYMMMRMSIGIVGDNFDEIVELYEVLSKRLYTHATPTIFNAGTPHPQMASCFLVAMKDDSLEGIMDTAKECAILSKYAGGVGLHVHNIRSTGSYIRGTNGESTGLIPFLGIYNKVAKAFNQGGKRPGSFAIYLEMHHADIEMFVELRKNTGDEDLRARDLFLALWMSDLFMERKENDMMWSLFDPNTAPGLSDVYGDEYKKLYEQYEKEGRAVKTVKARDLWTHIINCQIECGIPYIVNKDQINLKSNQKNLGVIKSSNLCVEIAEYSDPNETAVCHLASLCLPRFFKEDGTYDYELLSKTAGFAIKNLNRVVDRGFYPTETAKRSSVRHRPLGLGVSGLHDVFHIMKIGVDTPEADKVNRQIFETIYRGAIMESIKLAKEHGTYETYNGSPASFGKFQFDMWDDFEYGSLMWCDWEVIRGDMLKYGLRNSLLVALMPTGTSATIAGVTECFEITTSNIYSRKVLSGQFTIINKYLVKELIDLGLWDESLAHEIMEHEGSVARIARIPADIRDRYKTVWEHSMRTVIDLAAGRSPFVCQSQSMNLYVKRPSVPKMNSMLTYAHSKKLKTLMYYLHTRSTSKPMAFTIDKTSDTNSEEDEQGCVSCHA